MGDSTALFDFTNSGNGNSYTSYSHTSYGGGSSYNTDISPSVSWGRRLQALDDDADEELRECLATAQAPVEDYCEEPRPAHCGADLEATHKQFLAEVMKLETRNNILSLVGLLLVGVLCGYYRHIIYTTIYGQGSGVVPGCLLHVLPCTHKCALCQEARAAKRYAAYTGVGPSRESDYTMQKMTGRSVGV